jgi:hypothetical protein
MPEESSAVLLRAKVEDLEEELRVVRKRERRHFTWALVGISPAALLPAIGLFLEGSFGLVVILVILVTFTQVYQGVMAGAEAARLEEALERLARGEKG